MTRRRLLAVVALVHLLASLTHGVAHEVAEAPLTDTQNALVGGFVFVLPVVALGLLVWNRRRATGATAGNTAAAAPAVLLVGLVGSLAVGTGFHYLLPGADNVASVHGHGQQSFATTAALLTVVDLLCVVVVAAFIVDDRLHLGVTDTESR
ncbi:hypothetical protein [Haloarchaeobius sp. DFWS5]|uniref:hypothetical protein n=1 Tax=Haloarchaeobius sp. DFWS5 TaxID=3446114 RepID=UPI003EB81940